MTDYGHELLLGTQLNPPGDRAIDVIELARITEQVGLDMVSIADHPYWPETLDAVALLSVIVNETERVRVFANLFNLPLRPPPVLARTAVTLDIISGGRFELGLAPGAQQLWAGITAEGGPLRDAGESIDALVEAVELIRTLWTPGDDVSFEGKHYRLDGAKRGPAPVHDMEIWLGAYQPRLLRTLGRIGDGWIPSSPSFPPTAFRAANDLIDAAAIAAGRAPAAVRRLYNIGGEFNAIGTGFLQGPPAMWVEQLAELTLTEGVSAYLLYRVESEDIVRRFAAEVAPALRELLAAERKPTAQE